MDTMSGYNETLGPVTSAMENRSAMKSVHGRVYKTLLPDGEENMPVVGTLSTGRSPIAASTMRNSIDLKNIVLGQNTKPMSQMIGKRAGLSRHYQNSSINLQQDKFTSINVEESQSKYLKRAIKNDI